MALNFNGGERGALTGDLYIAKRIYEGTVAGKPNSPATNKYMLQNKSYALSGTLPTTGNIQLFESGGRVISGTTVPKEGGTGTALTIYLGNKLELDMEHTFEGGPTSAKFVKNGVTMADDVSGFNLVFKTQIANINEDILRDRMFVSEKNTEGVRDVGSVPNSNVYNKVYLVSYVDRMADGSYSIIQARKCRILVSLPTGGGGEEHKKAELTITPLADEWANAANNYMADFTLTSAATIS